jgi:acetylornithine/succinyldiaminopimelate/putrescine aminotransferase
VYGEYVQSPQYRLAKLLSEQLPESLCTSYFVNSGTESIEGAMKLSKRATGRSEIISCKFSYYGSTHGALSIMGNEAYKSNYRPLLSDCNQIIFNDINSLKNISNKTAAVFVEPIQGASGFIPADYEFLLQLRKKCDSTGSLLVFDEIQTGFGRLGTLFAFQHFNIVPDILCLAKGMGGGMPIGAFISSFKLMNLFTHNPELGHITTFGGHPVNCAASLSVLQYLLKTNLLNEIEEKEMLFRENLVHPKIKEIRGIGLMLSIELDSEVLVKKVVDESMKNNLLLFYFLFTKTSFRITPPLTISNEEIIKGCKIIKRILG